LLIARGLVGIGEAAYTPAGAVISASFPQEVRAPIWREQEDLGRAKNIIEQS